jgi:hypothetical protein
LHFDGQLILKEYVVVIKDEILDVNMGYSQGVVLSDCRLPATLSGGSQTQMTLGFLQAQHF